jgi:peptide chain release factor subunit 1
MAMVITSHQRYELKKFVAELKPKRGRHTELVSVYIPAGYDIIKVIQQLQDEQGTATNIKSASTRNNVLDALERMVQHLRLYKGTPKNGLAAFSGNVAEREGDSDVRVWSIEPPIPNKLRLYRCDKTFVLEPIEEMLESDEEWGLVVMDNRDATIGLLKGKSIQVLVKTHSEVPGKIKAGGQSAWRFSQNRELAANAHYKKIADYMKDQFLPRLNLKGILIGGPGPNKYKLAEGGFITGDVQKKVLGIKDIGDTGESGLNELVDRSQDLLAEAEIADEKKVVNRFLELLATDDAMVRYGRDDCLHVLEAGAVDILLLSEANDDRTVEEFEAVAKNYGTTVKIISTETREGAQLRDIGKIAAILRYRVQR